MPFDSIVLTVGSAKQKALCEKLLFSKSLGNICVISDDDSGCRIGSGGAMLNTVSKFCGGNKKVLLINSGGFSKRSINYAVRGKAFASICERGETVTLLELIIREAEKLSEQFSSGLLVSCSDILVNTDSVLSPLENCTGFCVRADFETGSRHGVMFGDENGMLSVYPHKAGVPALRYIAESLGESSVLIDTGLTFFNSEFIEKAQKMLRAESFIGKMKGTGTEISLYSDIIFLLSQKADKERYLNEEGLSNSHRELRKILLKYLCGISMEVREASNQSFLHFGSVSESLGNIRLLSEKDSGERCFINSSAEPSCSFGEGSVIENSALSGKCVIGKNCLISDITLNDAAVPDNTAVCGIKLANGDYTAIVCPVSEDPKALKSGVELWETPRFYRGKSFTESFNKYIHNTNEPKISMRQAVENADYLYLSDHIRYISDLIKSSGSVSDAYILKRNRVISDYFAGREALRRVECSRECVTVALPVRVNLSGTWSDAMPYCTDNGGEVINMAVTVNGGLPITVTVERLKDKIIEFRSDDESTLFSPEEINARDSVGFSDFNLHRAALTIMGFTPETVIEDGFRLSTRVSGIAKGSGLGTSSILLAGCFRALGLMFSHEYGDKEIIKMVFAAEQLMKTGGGWQDQTGGIIPGIKITESVPGINQAPLSRRFEVSDSFRAFLNSRLVLISTGRRHFGRFIVGDIMSRYANGNNDCIKVLNALKALNRNTEKAILNEDKAGFSNCINRQWELLKQLSPMISNERTDEICSVLSPVADAVCICGAGGGGYLLTVLKQGVDLSSLAEYIASVPVLSGIPEPIKQIALYD